MDDFYAALEERHLKRLTFQEIRRALQSLSGLYVQKRGQKLADGAVFDGAGKRAAFALYYGAMHYYSACQVVEALDLAASPLPTLLDLGCGSGVVGAAWAQACGARVTGIDENPWVVQEARWTYKTLAVQGTAQRGDLTKIPLSAQGIVLGYTVNELSPQEQQTMLAKLLAAHAQGASILVLEPISRRIAPWWESWSAVFRRGGGRDDDWRFPSALPERLALLDKAAGLDHRREVTARSLFLPGTSRLV